MEALFNALTSATNDLVYELYRRGEQIELADGKINNQPAPPWIYAAVLERICYNANLIDGRFRPGARSQILTEFRDQTRTFDVEVGPGEQMRLTLRP